MIDKNDEIVIQDEQKDQLFKQTLTRLERCHRTKKVNTSDTIALVSKAMGSRTITDFANAMNENVMKISRILSGTTVTLKPELIAKITAYASPDTDYSLDELMKAQGFVDLFQRVNRGMRFVEGCRKTITDELLKNNKTVKYVNHLPNDIPSEFVVLTDALTTKNEEWVFECKIINYPKTIDSAYVWLYRAMAAYYCGASYCRVSLIVDSEDAFNAIKSKLSEYRIPNEISIILASDDGFQIIDEYVIPLTDGRETISFFEKHRHDK